MTTPTQADILKNIVENAISRDETSVRILNSMEGFTPLPEMNAFYEHRIEVLQKFLKALSFSNEVDVELCELLEKEDYVVVAKALDNELAELLKSIQAVSVQLFQNAASNAMESSYNNYYIMLQAKTDFYDLYNKVRFS